MDTGYPPTTTVSRQMESTLDSTNKAPTCFREVALLMAAPWTDDEIEQLSCQEPLPPNQSFQLPASEQPTENQPTYIETK